VLGICGGYQMLGRSIADPDGIEGSPGTSQGLGLLDVKTTLTSVKQLRVEQATHAASGTTISGYHMHMGVTEGADRGRAFADVAGVAEGAISADGRVMGTYLHGLFADDPFRRAFLGNLASPDLAYEASIEQTLDDLAAHLEKHLDIDALLELAEPVRLI
jgi:adenosylcobyric acid synthase